MRECWLLYGFVLQPSIIAEIVESPVKRGRSNNASWNNLMWRWADIAKSLRTVNATFCKDLVDDCTAIYQIYGQIVVAVIKCQLWKEE